MYKAKAKPIDEKLSERIKSTNWSQMPLALIGFDVYVDVNGDVGFYEGNSVPFALGDYNSMYGGDLNEAIVSGLKGKGLIGINISPDTELRSARNYNGSFAAMLCHRNGIDYVAGRPSTLKWDKKKKQFYFDDEGTKKRFDFLFNRCPGSVRRLMKIVPQKDWLTAPVASPIVYSAILSDKFETSSALRELGLDSPLSYIVNNPDERVRAMKKVAKHIRENHPDYVEPFIFIKPVNGTGARGARVLRDEKSKPSRVFDYPCLVTERITTFPLNNYGSNHMVDARMFYFNGHASHSIGRVAPLSVENAGINDGKAFSKRAFVTNLCQGGSTTRFDPTLENTLREYVLAAALAIDDASKKYMEKLNGK